MHLGLTQSVDRIDGVNIIRMLSSLTANKIKLIDLRTKDISLFILRPLERSLPKIVLESSVIYFVL